MSLRGPVPDAVNEAFEHYGECYIPEQLIPQVREIYELGAERKCMTCSGDIGPETVLVINVNGITEVYCSHRCHQDMMVIGWMSQTYEDLTQAVQFRGQQSDEG